MGNAEKRKKLRTTINDMLANPAVDLSQNEMAKLIGCSTSALSTWRAGKYKGSNVELEKKIQMWLDSYSAGKKYATDLPADPDWQETPTAQRVWNAIEMAHLLKSLVVVYGAAGSGKTKTCRHYQGQRSNVLMITATKSSSTGRCMMELLCDALKVSDPGCGAYAVEKAVKRKLRGGNYLVIVDEAQQLTIGALEQLRQLQDDLDVGMVWAGNEPLYTQMTGGFRAPKFAQIFSRIAQRTHIEVTTADDVDPVAAAMGVTDADAVKYLREIGILPGGLRGVVKTLQLAGMAAAGSGQPLSKQMIARAWRKLTGSAE